MLFRLSRKRSCLELAPPASIEDAKREVVSLAAAGLPVPQIASQTGHSPDVVRNVISTWAHDEARQEPLPVVRQVREIRPPKPPRPPKEPLTSAERALRWLRAAAAAVGVLAAGAAVVSYQAQLQLVERTKHSEAAYVQAAIPDLGALVFALMGVSLALQGKRAVRARALNALCVGLSIGMNALAAKPGWHDLSIWVMAPSVYAVASDSLIWLIRLTVLNGRKGRAEDEGSWLIEMVGVVLLWILRLIFHPIGTYRHFNARLAVPEAPVKPQVIPPPKVDVISPDVKPLKVIPPASNGHRHSKTSEFLKDVSGTYGGFSAIGVSQVAGIVRTIAPGPS